jgi:hypothetical protein
MRSEAHRGIPSSTCTGKRHLNVVRSEVGTLSHHRRRLAIVWMVRIADRGGAQNMGIVWVLCRNRRQLTWQAFALGRFVLEGGEFRAVCSHAFTIRRLRRLGKNSNFSTNALFGHYRVLLKT